MAITMTDAAAARVSSFLANRGKGIGLRLGVKTTGCSGLAYVLEFVDELTDEDKVFEQQGVKIIVDAKSLIHLDGTELDFVKEGLNEGFQFNNPNAKVWLRRKLQCLRCLTSMILRLWLSGSPMTRSTTSHLPGASEIVANVSKRFA